MQKVCVSNDIPLSEHVDSDGHNYAFKLVNSYVHEEVCSVKGLVWYGTVRCGAVRCGACGAVRCGAVRYGTVCSVKGLLVDTGETTHIIRNKCKFQEFDSSFVPEKIKRSLIKT